MPVSDVVYRWGFSETKPATKTECAHLKGKEYFINIWKHFCVFSLRRLLTPYAFFMIVHPNVIYLTIKTAYTSVQFNLYCGMIILFKTH